MTHSDQPTPARGPIERRPDRQGPRSRRQVDFAPRPDFGRAGGRRNPDHRPARGRGRAQYRQGDAGAGRAGRAQGHNGAATWSVRGVGVAGFAQPAGAARFRQFRHRLPAGDGRGRRLPDRGDVRWRRLAAQPADAAGARSAGIDGRAGRRGQGGRPAAAVAAGRARSAADPLPHAGGVGADQIRGAAGGAVGARRHHGDRDRGQPRPHRTDAEAFRRADRLDARGQPWPQDRAHRPARTARRRRRGAGRSVLGGVSDRRGADRRGLRHRADRRDDQSAAHRAVHHACAKWAPRSSRARCAATPASRWRNSACAPRNCAASRCRRNARRR